MHVPPRHIDVDPVHLVPQPPQLSGSFVSLTHALPQHCKPSEHAPPSHAPPPLSAPPPPSPPLEPSVAASPPPPSMPVVVVPPQATATKAQTKEEAKYRFIP